jgi:hypothetical protein
MAFPVDDEKLIPAPEHFEKTFDSMAVAPYLHPTAE